MIPLVLTRTSLTLGLGISKSSKVKGLFGSQKTAPRIYDGPPFTWYDEVEIVEYDDVLRSITDLDLLHWLQ